jgi:hypothetical protein
MGSSFTNVHAGHFHVSLVSLCATESDAEREPQASCDSERGTTTAPDDSGDAEPRDDRLADPELAISVDLLKLTDASSVALESTDASARSALVEVDADVGVGTGAGGSTAAALPSTTLALRFGRITSA